MLKPFHTPALAFLLVLATTSQAAPPNGSIPNELIGQWRWTTISGVSYENSTTGQIEGGGGMSAAFSFSKNGRYTFDFTVKQHTYNFLSESNTHSEGTVVFDQGSFIPRPTKGHYLGWNNGKKVVDRSMTATERAKNTSYKWKWVYQDGKRALMIGPSEDALRPFSREKR